jgi:hypothetical protein
VFIYNISSFAHQLQTSVTALRYMCIIYTIQARKSTADERKGFLLENTGRYLFHYIGQEML